MKYRAEIVQGGVVVDAGNFEGATHPNQVVRRIVDEQKDFDYADIFVMNEVGERWKYSARRLADGGLSGKIVKSSFNQLSTDQINSVFAGNVEIRRANS